MQQLSDLPEVVADLTETNDEATYLIYQHQAVVDAQRTALAELARENEAMKEALKSRILRVYQTQPESPVPDLDSICWN
jgi:hypothetical protein